MIAQTFRTLCQKDFLVTDFLFGLFSRPVSVRGQVDQGHTDQGYPIFHQKIEDEDLHGDGPGVDQLRAEEGDRREGDEDEEQVVDGDADGVADEDAQPLVTSGDAADKEVVDFGVDQLADQFGDDGGADDAPERGEDGAELGAAE